MDQKHSRMIWAGLLLGLGFGGFFDGIVFHQVLQWHHMLTSAGYPPDTVANLQMNTLADGFFHLGTYLLSLAGLFLLIRVLRHREYRDVIPLVLALMLAGWGLFNLVEGLIDHFILQIHHVRDDLPAGAEQLAWDVGFLVWGAAMLAIGWVWSRSILRREPVNQPVRVDGKSRRKAK